MVIATGTVRHGAIEVESGALPEGATVTVLVSEGDETFVLAPADEAKLVLAMHEADQQRFVAATELLTQLRSA